MKKCILLSAIFAMTILTSCDKPNSLGAPKNFFSATKVGKSPDYGIFKGQDDDDHVATVHGFADDLSICLKLVDKLNETQPGAYRCQPLNH
jgi:hypothetical protein